MHPATPGCPGQTDRAEAGGDTHPGKCCPAPTFPPAPSKAKHGQGGLTLPAGAARTCPCSVPMAQGFGRAGKVLFLRGLPTAQTKALGFPHACGEGAPSLPAPRLCVPPPGKASDAAGVCGTPRATGASSPAPSLAFSRRATQPKHPARKQAAASPPSCQLGHRPPPQLGEGQPAPMGAHTARRWVPIPPGPSEAEHHPPGFLTAPSLGWAGRTGLTSGRGSRVEGLGLADHQQQQQQRGNATSGTHGVPRGGRSGGWGSGYDTASTSACFQARAAATTIFNKAE